MCTRGGLDVGNLGGKRNMCPVCADEREEKPRSIWPDGQSARRPSVPHCRCRLYSTAAANKRVVSDDSRQVLVE